VNVEQQENSVLVVVVEELAKLEYEALRVEERDRMNGRLTLWGIFLSLIVGFSVASVQSSEVVYTLAVFPGLVGCLALHSRHSEEVLRTIRKYLYQLEKRYGYSGYEHYTRMMPRSTYGGHMDALRYAFVLSQGLAMGMVLFRLVTDHVMVVVILLLLVLEGVVVVLTWRWLRK
jgi:hypothetical protein